MPLIYHEGYSLGDGAENNQLLKDTVGWTGKNLLKNTQSSKTINGITVTVNSDGTITTNGTATTSVFLDIPISLPIGEYVFSGTNNQSGGSPSKYYARLRKSGGIQFATSEISPLPVQSVNGSEIKFKVLQDNLDIRYQICIYPAAGAISNLTFYPMIRKADIIDPTYEPYHESVEVMYEEEIHGVNLLDVKVTTQTINGITYTVNTDKSISVSGTASANSRLYWYDSIPLNGRYIFGRVEKTSFTGVGNYSIMTRKSGSITNPHGINFNIASQLDGIEFDEAETLTEIAIYIASGAVANLKIYPMLRKAEIEDNTYRPYNYQAIQNQLNAQGVLGAKNLLENEATSQTINGVTFTVNADGSVTANGTATANATIKATPNSFLRSNLKEGISYILSGCPSGGSSSTYALQYSNNTDDAKYDTGSGVEFVDYDRGTYPNVSVYILIRSGVTASNLTFKPMLRLASDPDDTYQPYAMTNRELTEKVFEKRTLTSADDLNNITETGIYGITTKPTNAPENTTTYCTLIVQKTSIGDIRQIIIRSVNAAAYIYTRSYGGSPLAWTPWYKFTGTVVS